MNNWYIMKLIASLGFLAATVYLVYEMSQKESMIMPIFLFAIMMAVYAVICRIVKKKAEEANKKNGIGKKESNKGKEERNAGSVHYIDN